MPFLFTIPDDGEMQRESLLVEAAAVRAEYANLKVRLFKSSMPLITKFTTLADLDEHQCAFSGYTPDGNTIAAFGEPFADPDTTDVMLVAPTTQFNFVTPEEDPPVTEAVGGFYLVDSGGDLRGAVRFEEPVNMATDSNSLPIVVARRFD